MGEFFNRIISKMDKIPIGKKTRKDSLEELRIKFNEEQYGKPIRSETSTETGITSPPGDEQVKPIADIPPRPNRPKRTRRPHKGTTRKTRNN